MTKYGKLIAKTVASSHDHPTAEQIHQRLHEQGVPLSLATVYNNLKTLVEDGILRRITLDGSPDRFDQAESHQHLICEGCGKLTDACIRDLTAMLQEDLQVEVSSYDLHIHYLCEDCRRKKQNEDEQGN